LVTHFVDPDGPASPSRAARAPRIVTCFVCGREFGTASLPLHEPQCIQRWTLQNTKLPPQWQRSLPEKPVGPITIDDWNKFAWDSSKRADSVQCPNCLRRFCPDRINSHERVCFKKQNVQPGEPQQAQPDSAHGRGSPLVECHLCRKKFGTRSIGIHEPQCLKKWQQTQQALGEGQPSGQPALDKARDCPQLEGPPERKPLAIEFPSSKPP
ncbi:zinc finger protein 474-like, partial [Frankliniella occidentalis]|uniref:Zinc finger protein 474-like n=1 Tax=Frankliniella occidentalis TaxID=133901 RepID=A0A9C6XAG4_FRAOC